MNPKYVPAQTSVPDWVMTYCRQLSDVHYQRKLNQMYEHMLESFLAYEPWKAVPPLEWRAAQVHSPLRTGNRKGEDLGWVAMNMMVPHQLFDRMKLQVEIINANDTTLTKTLSMRTFLYTVVYWWCTMVYPYDGPGILPN